MNLKAIAIAALSAGAAVLSSSANSASAATFTGSFTGNFDDSNFGGFVDSGTISYTFEGNDLDDDGFAMLPGELDSLLLESSGFSTPEYNFSLFFEFPDTITAIPALAFFDFNSETLTGFVADSSSTAGERILGFDENGFFFPGQEFYRIEVDLDGDGSSDSPGEFIASFSDIPDTSAIPEPMTLLGTFTALGLGAVAKRKHSR